MTTIAYRAGVLAADTAISRGGTHMASVEKIVRRPDGHLAGIVGVAALQGPFFAWFMGGEVGEPPAVPNEDGSTATGLIFRPDGVVVVYESGGSYVMTPDPYMAIGSGRDVALGAMYVGADPEAAVRAAIAHDHGTGGNITVLQHADREVAYT